MLETLDDAAVHRWCGGGLAALRAHQHEIDELNVYPVPDGDTGTNLVLTLASAQQALEDSAYAEGRTRALGDSAYAEGQTRALGDSAYAEGRTPALEGEVAACGPAPTPLGQAMRLMARGALLGARGNSGVIVSQILRGMAEEFAGAVAVRGGELARALRSASEAAYAAVARPVEGTVLSVVAAAADAAGKVRSDDLLAVARAASRAATEALARTPQQLPVLARAGVVDAGGRGLCLLLDALVEALSATTAQQPADPDLPAATAGPAAGAQPGSGARSDSASPVVSAAAPAAPAPAAPAPAAAAPAPAAAP
ncbi:DAK2 domain-containing protein, partial [Jidongwangia harbinensis]|uniref:DAK2 domain-containing protein n=1 Tax=Jidongwangia harbinensis TaxID=2878561 RepID=UPI001CD95EE1